MLGNEAGGGRVDGVRALVSKMLYEVLAYDARRVFWGASRPLLALLY